MASFSTPCCALQEGCAPLREVRLRRVDAARNRVAAHAQRGPALGHRRRHRRRTWSGWSRLRRPRGSRARCRRPPTAACCSPTPAARVWNGDAVAGADRWRRQPQRQRPCPGACRGRCGPAWIGAEPALAATTAASTASPLFASSPASAARWRRWCPTPARTRSANGPRRGSPAWARRGTRSSRPACCASRRRAWRLSVSQGRMRFAGEAPFDVIGRRRRAMSTLPALGSYRVNLRSDAATGSATVNLTTTEGPLRLTGQGQWTDSGLALPGRRPRRQRPGGRAVQPV